jgi:hypothetical protein
MNPQTWLTSVALTLGVAFGAQWDDETFLGRGPVITAGVAVPISRHVAVEGEVAAGRHHRNAGYLEATGTPVSVTGRLAYSFTGPDASVRPFVSAGLTWLRTTGDFTMGDQKPHWRSSLGAWELGTGVAIKAGERLTWRPEARWTFTGSDDKFTPGSLEPPLWIMRGGVTLAWK